MKYLFELKINPQFSGNLPADKITEVFPRQVSEACFSLVETKQPSKPEKVHFSHSFLSDLGVVISNEQNAVDVLSGKSKFNDFAPYSMNYGGHQFGNWAGQLGDGRAINIAELEIDGKKWQFQLKGAVPTPYSRGAVWFCGASILSKRIFM